MNPIVYISISVIVAACIGGITNYLAIKMLFHPREAYRIAKWRVPFTPGLIPKRRKEIASSLGHVVGDYLVTTDGLAGVLLQPQFRQKLEEKVSDVFVTWSHKEETLQELALRFLEKEEMEAYQEQLVVLLEKLTSHSITWLWTRLEQHSLTLGDLIPSWTEQKKERLSGWAATYLLEELKKEMNSPAVDAMLRQLMGSVMRQTGGVLGAIAGLFMDENKLVAKVKLMIEQKLTSLEVRRMVEQLIYRKVNEWEKLSLIEVIENIAKQAGRWNEAQRWGEEGGNVESGDVLSWVIAQAGDLLHWREWLERAGQLPLCNLVNDQMRNRIVDNLPMFVSWLLRFAVANVGRVIEALELPKLVEEQVSQFPVERLEQIVLSVSGREFRAITWLGALLGGMIGLFQAILLRWFV